MSDTPQADRVDGTLHPRETQILIGHDPVEAQFLRAFQSGRLHHGWLISGPRGVGKATLAWRIARFLLATPDPDKGGLFGDTPPPETLDIPPDHPVAHRIAARSEPGLYHITRTVNEKTGRLRDMIVAEDVRDLNKFLHMSATDGGRRVVLIDSADEMNPQAANALLKMLEEPPARTTLLLISHQPSRLLPTIRSRCRGLRLNALSPQDMARALKNAGAEIGDNAAALAELSGGSVGEAMRLIHGEGLALYAELIDLFATLPSLDRSRALKLADSMAGQGAAPRFDLFLRLLDVFFLRLARSGAMGAGPETDAVPGESKALMRLSPDPTHAREWARLGQELMARLHHGRLVNLDPAALVLDTLFKIEAQARAR